MPIKQIPIALLFTFLCTSAVAEELPFEFRAEVCQDFLWANPPQRIPTPKLKVDGVSFKQLFVYIEVEWKKEIRTSEPLYLEWRFTSEDGETAYRLSNFDSNGEYVFRPSTRKNLSRWLVSQRIWLSKENAGSYEFTTYVRRNGKLKKIDVQHFKIES